MLASTNKYHNAIYGLPTRILLKVHISHQNEWETFKAHRQATITLFYSLISIQVSYSGRPGVILNIYSQFLHELSDIQSR